MTNFIRQPFTPGGKFVASKTFRFHGRRYVKGDDFPWRRLSCSVRRLRKLYEGRFLNNDYIDPDAEQVEEVEEPVVGEEITGEVVDEQPTEVGELVYNPEVHEIINPDRGEWYMADAEGTRLLQLTSKEAKRLRKKSGQADINPDAVIEE